jgi:hypothetical protein
LRNETIQMRRRRGQSEKAHRRALEMKQRRAVRFGAHRIRLAAPAANRAVAREGLRDIGQRRAQRGFRRGLNLDDSFQEFKDPRPCAQRARLL